MARTEIHKVCSVTSPILAASDWYVFFFVRKLEKAVAGIGGNFQEKCWNFVLKSQHALNSRISGTGKGKPAANLGSTLPGTLSQPSVRGVFYNRQLQLS